MIRRTQYPGGRGAIHAAGVLFALLLVPGIAGAQVVNQPPTAFAVTIDGAFTNASEWSDVTPVTFNTVSGIAYTYTAINPAKTALCLMYDSPGDQASITGLSGPIEFNVGSTPATQQHFQVFFQASSPFISVWRSVGGGSPVPFNINPGGTPLMVGKRSFGPSRNSATPHMMHELSVLVDCSDPTLNCGNPTNHGVYSPDPSHWGASNSSSSNDPGHCVLPDSACGQGFPRTVDCAVPGSFSAFGDPVSNACVEILRGTGGTTRITKVPLPNETAAVPALNPWGVMCLTLILVTGGMVFIRRRYQAQS
jgi:hypothetical protein